MAAFLAALAVPGCDGLEFDVRAARDGVAVCYHDDTLTRVHGIDRRVDALTADELEAHGVPTLASSPDPHPAPAPSSTSSSRATRAGRRSMSSSPAAGRARAGRRVVVPAATLEWIGGLAPTWPRWLNALTPRRPPSRPRVELGCRGISVEWPSLDPRPSAAPGRPISTLRRGPCAAGRPPPPGAAGRGRDLRRGRRPRRLTSGPPGPHHGSPSGHEDRTTRRPHPVPARQAYARPRMSEIERADLVVVGAGTVGGWASWFARDAGVGRVVVLERGRPARAPAAAQPGIVRAQGGTPTTVALGRWSIDFYRRQAAEIGTDSGFRELGYLILAVTDEDERSGRERVAMQQARRSRRPLAERRRGGRCERHAGPDGHRGGSYLATDGHIDPPRNVRAYSLAMQRAGVELREGTAFTGLRTDPRPAAVAGSPGSRRALARSRPSA